MDNERDSAGSRLTASQMPVVPFPPHPRRPAFSSNLINAYRTYRDSRQPLGKRAEMRYNALHAGRDWTTRGGAVLWEIEH